MCYNYYIFNGESMFGAKVCANCGKPLKEKAEKYAGKSFCSQRCLDIYRHHEMNKMES